MTKAMLASLTAALALGACGQAGGPNAAAPVENVAVNEAAQSNVIDQVLSMSDRERNVVLIRALIDSNIRCDNVTASERIADVSGQPAWRAHCSNGSAHIVMLLPDGTARVLTRPQQS